MYFMGISSNLMSLAGIAIAIGVLVDAGIVVTENAFRFMEQRNIDPKDRKAVWDTVLESTKLVGRPVFFSMAIIILAFIPIFALTGQEGKLFHPLAFTKTFAMAGATHPCRDARAGALHIAAWRKSTCGATNPVMRFLRYLYEPVLTLALKHRVIAVCGALVLFLGAIFLATGIGSEFMPPLNEGDVMFMPVTDPAISIDEANKIMSKQDELLKVISRSRMGGRQGRTGRNLDRPVTDKYE